MNLDEFQARRRPHRFLVEIDDPECQAAYDTAIAAGHDPKAAECCNPLCYRVTKIECPYGPGEEHIDCALYEECSHKNPEYDPQFDGQATFTYKFDLAKPVGDPDRYVRVWDEGSTPQGIALALAFDLAMEEYDDGHDNPGWDRVEPQQCWVQVLPDSVDEALDDALSGLRPGWHTAYIQNGGDIEDTWLELDLVVPEHAEGCEV